MNARWYVSTDPTSDPITAAQVEAQLKVSSGFDSTTIDLTIPAAVRQVETDLRRSLINRTITLKLDHWPIGSDIYLSAPPFQSVTSVKYIDTDGIEQTLAENTDYEVKLSGDDGRVVVASGSSSWPSVKSDKKEPITIVYVAGYGSSASDVPADIRLSCLKMAVMMYTNGAVDDVVYKELIDGNRFYFNSLRND